jgi:hypothetical protein
LDQQSLLRSLIGDKVEKKVFKVGDTVWRYLPDAYGVRRFGVVKEVFLSDCVVSVEFEDELGVSSLQTFSSMFNINDDKVLIQALAAKDAFASEAQSAVAEHHRAGREVVVEREGKLVRLPPPSDYKK